MAHTSLAEIYRRSVTFPGPYLRMAGLEAARSAVEDQLEHLKGQSAVRLYARLNREAHTMAPDDVEFETESFKGAVEELFPKVFRGGFVISLWSVFEACIKDSQSMSGARRSYRSACKSSAPETFWNKQRSSSLASFP